MNWIDLTFAEALHLAADRHGERVAIFHGDSTVTYAELLRRVRAFARGLVDMGVRRGDHVALWMPDCPEWIVARWAVPYIGAVLVPINTRLRGRDLAYILRQSDSSVLILRDRLDSHDYLRTLSEILPLPDAEAATGGATGEDGFPKLRSIIVLGSDCPSGMERFEEVERRGGRLARSDGVLEGMRAAVAPGDVAQILYTSGTTALPKGAMVRHGALLQNNSVSVERLALSEADCYLASVPLFSATGTSFTLSVTISGASMVLLDRFSAEVFCRAVERYRVTFSFFLDTIVQDLRHYPRWREHDLSSLRTGTGAPLSPASFDFLTNEVGVPHVVGVFGMSETSNAICRCAVTDPVQIRRATSGLPVPGAEISIVDAETGAPARAGEVGEIRVAGFMVMAGYYNSPDENAAVFDDQGRLRTGDLGMLRADGRLVYRGRLKDMIKTSGFNVSTQEIEQHLSAIPGVREAAVVGVPDERLGEVAFAFVEVDRAGAPSPEEITRLCRAQIASYKVPRYIRVVDFWPRTSTGKIRKQELKEIARTLVMSEKA